MENSRSVNSRGYAVPKVAPAPDVNQAVVPPRHLEALWPLWGVTESCEFMVC